MVCTAGDLAAGLPRAATDDADDRTLPAQLPGRLRAGLRAAAGAAAPAPGRLLQGLLRPEALPPLHRRAAAAAEPGRLTVSWPAGSLTPASASTRCTRLSSGCSAATPLRASTMPRVASRTCASCTSAASASSPTPGGSPQPEGPLASACLRRRAARAAARC